MRRIFATLLIYCTLLATPAAAATFAGEFWNATSQVRNLNDADAVIASRAADATFTSTLIDYPRGTQTNTGSGSTTLSTFLGPDAGSLVGDGSVNLTYSVFRFTGFIDPSPTAQTYEVGSDDGFRLTIGTGADAVVVTSQFGQRGFRTSTGVVAPNTGLTAFELIYFENRGRTGVQFSIDGVTVTPSAVPLPAGFGLMLAGMAGLGMMARRKPRN